MHIHCHILKKIWVLSWAVISHYIYSEVKILLIWVVLLLSIIVSLCSSLLVYPSNLPTLFPIVGPLHLLFLISKILVSKLPFTHCLLTLLTSSYPSNLSIIITILMEDFFDWIHRSTLGWFLLNSLSVLYSVCYNLELFIWVIVYASVIIYIDYQFDMI